MIYNHSYVIYIVIKDKIKTKILVYVIELKIALKKIRRGYA